MSSTREQLIEQLGQVSKLLGDAKVAGAVVDEMVTNVNHREDKWSCNVATGMINATLDTDCPDIKTAVSTVICKFTEVEYNLNRSLERIAALEAELEQLNTLMPQDVTADDVAIDVSQVKLSTAGAETGRVSSRKPAAEKDRNDMDPNENLKRQRVLVAQINKARDNDSEDLTEEAVDLADLVSALDDWISGGGALPTDWIVKEEGETVR